MKVALNCILLRHVVSGVEGSLLHLAQELASRGQEQYRFYLPHNSAATIPARSGVEVVRPGFPTAWRWLRILWEQAVLPIHLRRHPVDIFHAPGYICPLLAPDPVILTVYDVLALRYPRLCRPTNRWHYRLFLPPSVQKAAGIIVPSVTTMNDLTSCLGTPSTKIRVIPLGIDERFFLAHDTHCGAQTDRNLDGHPFLLFVSRLEPKKNLPTLIEAFRLLKVEARIPHKLVIVGTPGWGVNHLPHLVRRHGLTREVFFEGFVDFERLRDLYCHATLFVFPSLYEGFGLPPLEAAACGVPVVCSNRGALPEVMGDAALFANPENAAELASAIRRLLTSPELRREFGARGRSRASLFTWKRAVAKTEEFYREILCSHRNASRRGESENRLRTG